VVNGGSAINLNANATTPVTVATTITDYNGCSDFSGSTETVALFRGDIASSSCITSSTPNPLICYASNTFTTSTCPNGGYTANATTTFNVQYFASPTDNANYSYYNKGWQGAVVITNPARMSNSSTSATTTLISLEAISSTPASIGYGSLAPGQVNNPSVTTTISDVGNTSTTFQFSAQQSLFNGTTLLATSSQQYGTSAGFGYGTGSSLSSTAVTLAGVTVPAPTSTNLDATNIFWLLQVPTGTPTGTYNGTNIFTGLSAN
jgi:hypothetical protein